MTSVVSISITDPGQVQRFLNDPRNWTGRLEDGGVATAYFCPLCGAMTPAADSASGANPARASHISYHVTLSSELQWLARMARSNRNGPPA